jgi:hypothetical protein
MYIPTIEEIEEQIKYEITTRHPLIRDFSPVSMLSILTGIVAGQTYLLYKRIDDSTKSVSILTATGTDLDALVVDRLPAGRQAGTQATGYLTFKCGTPATAAIPIPIGSKALALGQDGSRIYFETTAYGEIAIGDYSVIVEAHAVEPGTNGNISPYLITQLPYSIEGVSRVENATAFANGTDEESDDELRTRYYYAVLVPGKATLEVIEEHLTDLEDVSESHVYPRGSGDIEVIVDYDEGTGSDSKEIIDSLKENIAAGITSRGILGATITSGVVVTSIAECSGGKIWIRALENVIAGDSMTIEYVDSLGRTRTSIVAIPINTLRGDTLEATLEAPTDRAVSISNITYGDTHSYDVLIGMGEYPYLYVLPRTVVVDVAINITKTSYPETDLEDNIENSIETFLNSYHIGEDLEWSDVFLYVYMDHETNRMFEGIDTVNSCSISGGGNIISTTGSIINITEDQRIRPGTITVTVT